MIRRLLKDSAFYALSAAIPAATGLLLLPFYARQLGPREYGLLDATTVMLALISTVVALEIAQGVARFLPTADSLEARRRIGSTAFWFTAGVLGIAALAVWLAAPWVARFLLGAPEHFGVVRSAAFAMLSGGLQGIAVRHLRWSLRARSYVSAVAVTNLVTAGIGVALVLHWKPAAEALLLGQAGGNAAGLILAWVLSRKELSWSWDTAALRIMLRFSSPLVFSTLGVIATGQLGRLMLASLGSLEDAGHFGVAARLAGILGLLTSGLQLAIGPLIYAAHEKPETPAALAAATRLFATVVIIGWMILVVFAPELVGLLTSSAFATSAGLIAPLGGAAILSSALVFAPGLEIKHRTGTLALVYLLGGACNLALCGALIGPFGATGAGVAALLSGLIQTTLVFRLSQKHYFVPYPWPALLAAATLGICCSLLLSHGLAAAFKLVWLKIAITTLSSAVIAWLLLHPLRHRRTNLAAPSC